MPTSKFSTATLQKTLTKGPDPDTPWFQGWFVDSEGSAESIACPTTQSAAFSGSYIHCCDIRGDSCSPAYTACNDGGVAPGASASVSPCMDGFTCKTLSVFKQSPIPSPAPPVTSGVFCAPDAWSAYTIYRTLLVDYAVTSTVPLSVASTAGSSYGVATGTDGASGDKSSSSSSNTGVIAGAAVGGVVAIAIIAALLWFFCARRKKRERQSAQHGYSSMPPGYNQSYDERYKDGYGSYAGGQRYTDAAKYSHPAQEMDGTIPNSELDAGFVNNTTQQQRYELAASPK